MHGINILMINVTGKWLAVNPVSDRGYQDLLAERNRLLDSSCGAILLVVDSVQRRSIPGNMHELAEGFFEGNLVDSTRGDNQVAVSVFNPDLDVEAW